MLFVMRQKKKCLLFNDSGTPFIVDQSHLSVEGMTYFEKWLSTKLSII